MKRQKLRNALLLGAALFILTIGSAGGYVLAATPPKQATPPSNTSPSSLKISPLRTDISIKPGESGTVPVIVSNITSQPIVVKAIENDFVAGDEKGTPALILDENSYAPTHSLKRFMSPLTNVTVPANGSTQVNVVITVPKTAQAGGYFGAIRFAPASLNDQLSVSVGASVVSLILLTVPGDLVEHLNLDTFNVQQNGGASTNFRSPDGLEVVMRFKNTGNVQVAPFGKISVLKGKKVVYDTAFNSNDQKENVLPDSARRWNVPLKSLGKFGKYTVAGSFSYGTKNETIEVKKTVWIVPTTYIFIAIGGIVGLVVLVLLIIYFLKSYKRRILRSNRRY